ncbi:DUF7344 domain-containing protein [Haloarcula salinisoli]|uniref:DUF7344 domain-containing protein n=1 Tax=Haloarcula salinisoli TaxID=2487746 RepID=A0A8J7YNR2_9EURY|nr:hypothetical protein [Halomicroarcula salinisoli]MBX0305151.1 hypothetical protein [Halomicroarcula salinisoli]
MSSAPTLDTVLDVCGHKHRRIVLATLANQRQSLSIDDLTNAIIKHNHHLSWTEIDDETVKQIHIGLYQVHLPKLTDSGFIEYDPERKVAELTTQAGREDSHLSAILAEDSDLPITH